MAPLASVRRITIMEFRWEFRRLTNVLLLFRYAYW